MLSQYKGTKASALFQFVALNIPLENKAFEGNEDSWAKELLILLSEAMEVGMGLVDTYYPITIYDESIPPRNEYTHMELVAPCIDNLELNYIDKLNIISLLLLFFVINKKYDGKGRTCIKQMVFSLGLVRDDFYYIENKLGKYLRENESKIESLVKVTKKKDPTKKMIRYAKIGTVALGAGAVLAVTGGLAAPAIAGALVVMGSTSAAAMVSVGAMATIFGTAGAGLAGYKMMKRTKTLNEFEFEPYGEKGQLALMVVISGWMEKESDYKRAFGAVPDTMPLNERLGRYYTVHCPHRLPKVSMEAAMFEKDPDSLFDQLLDLYGHDPRDIESLIPPKRKPLKQGEASEEAFNRLITFIDQLTTKHSFFSGFSKSTGKADDSSKTANAEESSTTLARDFQEKVGIDATTDASNDGEGLSGSGEPSPGTTTMVSTTNDGNSKSENGTKEAPVSYDYWYPIASSFAFSSNDEFFCIGIGRIVQKVMSMNYICCDGIRNCSWI
jgi:hypothetical protein